SAKDVTLKVRGTDLTAKETLDGKEYYVIKGDDIDHVTAQAGPNFAHNKGGSFDLDIRYAVTDYSNDGKVDPVTVVKETTYSVGVTPVTDQVSVETGKTVTVGEGGKAELPISNNGDVSTITLDLTQTLGAEKGDYDGSEQLTQVIVSGLPVGMLVTDLTKDGEVIGSATMLSEGKWLIQVKEGVVFNDKDGFSVDLSFKAGPHLTDAESQVTVTVVTQDTGATNTESDSITLTVKPTITIGGGPGNVDSVDISFEATDFKGTEDTTFKLSEVVTATLNTQANFSVVIKLPEGATIKQGGTELTSIKVGEDEIWVISGTGGQGELDALLSKLEVTPPKDWNSEVKDDLPIDITFNAYLDNGSTSSKETDDGLPVVITPETDTLDVSVAFENAQEGENIGINITLANKVDAETTLVDGSTQIKLTGDYTKGQLFYVDTKQIEHELSLNSDGTYSIPIEAGTTIANNGELTLNLVYKPSAEEMYQGGNSFDVVVSVQNQENGSTKTEVSTGGNQTNVAVVNNDYDI
ncbi:MAG: hypothetical protein GX029_14180, partial [Pseudomonadaceae bacterium]|nr:hypothetical protein [Pseudomonadaceae bacterium]